MRKHFYLFLLLGFISSLEARTWKSTKGVALEADYVSSTANEVTLKRSKDGQTFTVPITRLSEADQLFIKEKAANQATGRKPITGEYAKLITGNWELSQYQNLPYAFYGAKDLDGAKKYPLVVVLHGKSSNNENGKQIGFARKFADSANYSERPCLIFSPLCYQPHGQTGGGWDDAPGEEALDLIRDLVKEFPIVDPDRVYVIGYSMGGFGTWHFLKTETRLFAAGVPVAGYSSGVGKLRSMPIWAFHGAKDTVVKVDGAQNCAEELKRSRTFKYTEFPEDGHGIIGKVVGDEAVHKWLFEQKK